MQTNENARTTAAIYIYIYKPTLKKEKENKPS